MFYRLVRSHGYYNLHIENCAATNQDFYPDIAYKILIYVFQRFTTRRGDYPRAVTIKATASKW